MDRTGFIEKSAIAVNADSTEDGTAQLAARRLFAFLKLRAARYAMGDHSSLPQTLMEELLASVVFTLSAGGCSGRELATANLNDAFTSGLACIEQQLAYAKRLFQTACIGAPGAYSRTYRDTLASIGGFFTRYDWQFFAHAIPCDIDYQLLHPVSERLQGVFYIAAYLEQVIGENEILRRFDADTTGRLLAVYCHNYKESIVNLCEPVVINALGRTLLHEDVRALNISPAQREQLAALFAPLSEDAARALLDSAAQQFFESSGLQTEPAKESAAFAASELYPRIAAALPENNLNGIFLTFA